MLLSLIICTYRRDKELRDVIRTLCPLPSEIELILVDQNDVSERVDKDALLELGLDSDQLKIIHRRLGSLSSARNEGFRMCRGIFIGMPDDDNYYDDSFREGIVEVLSRVRLDSRCGGVILNWNAFRGFPELTRKMNSLEALQYGNSGTMIVRRNVVCVELGMSPFPEDMSPGTRFPAGDETYFLARYLEKSRQDMLAVPSIYINHPIFPDTDDRERVYSYGFGALAYKLVVRRWGPGALYALKLLVGPIIRMSPFSKEKDRRKKAWIMLKRRWRGAIDYAVGGREER